ncbi:MAG TPA: 50S ribosomal protein L25 [Candidatus Paceibacterota bacterium]|nr:50S ribosomal protein L25 [Candidatus Paceibacterota bacterium]
MATKATERLELAATGRDVTGRKVRHLRKQGIMPAVLYGKGVSSTNLSIGAKDFDTVFRKAGESTLVFVKMGATEYPTLIKDIARDPRSGDAIHADFYAVSLTEKITARVPVVFVGESVLIKSEGGTLVRNVNELEVQALPTDLPKEITVDISGLKSFTDQITLGDIKVPKATLPGDPGEIIATVQAPKSEEELAAELAAPTADVSAVEEIKKEVPAEEAAEEGEAAPAAAPAAEAKKE